FSAAPGMHEWNAVLFRHQTSVGLRQCFGADEILVDPGQARSAQCSNIIADQWLKPDIASFGHESSADTDRQIMSTRIALADMCKLRGEISTCCDLQENLRQVDTRQASIDLFTEPNETERFFQFIKSSENQIIFATDRLDASCRIGRQIGSDSMISSIKFVT